jgi:hypothetical protein
VFKWLILKYNINKIYMDPNNYLKGLLASNIELIKKLILIVIILFIVIILSFYISEKYRVNKTMEKMYVYNDFMISNSINNEEIMNEPLCNFYISSAFRPQTAINQMYDYSSLLIIKRILRYGARCLYFEVFTTYDKPVISVGYQRGNWKLSLNSLDFDETMQAIATTAFSSGNVNNYTDPLFLAFKLNVMNDHNILKRMKESIIKYFGSHLLEIDYGYTQKNIALEPISNFLEKVVIMCSEGYENSTLEEIVNAKWDSNVMRKINNQSIDPNVRISNYVKEDLETLKNYNKGALSLIVPEERGMFKRQYNPNYAFEAGCQFVFMHFQETDGLMDFYATKFRNNSFILKPPELRGEPKNVITDTLYSRNLTKDEKKDPIVSQCNIEPKPYVPKRDYTSEPLFKADNSNQGVCFISDRPCSGAFEQYQGDISLISQENNKVIDKLNKQKVNVGAGLDSDGFKYYNIKPYMCCAKEKNVPVSNKFIMAPFCRDPTKNMGKIGVKATKNDASKTSFTQGTNADKDYTWVHPTLCRVDDVSELKDQRFCVLAKDICPKEYEPTSALMENNMKLCCREALNN